MSRAAASQLPRNGIWLTTSSQTIKDGIYPASQVCTRTTALSALRKFGQKTLQQFPKLVRHSVIIKAARTLRGASFVFELF